MPRANTSREKLKRGSLRKSPARGVGRMVSAQSLRDLERRYSVWELRKGGYTLREIAQSLGTTEQRVREDIILIAKRIASDLAETVEESRSLQVERLDAMLKKYQPLAEAGNLSAASMILQIESRRSKLLALDLPEQKKLEVTGIREYVGVNIDDV